MAKISEAAAKMRSLIAIFAPALALLIGATCSAAAQDIVDFIVENHGHTDTDVPATFGSVFVAGDLPKGAKLAATADNQPIPIQLDVKATHHDGSLRHGDVTVIIPHLRADGRTRITLRRENGVAATEPAIAPSALPADFDAVVTLSTKDKILTASAKSILSAGSVEKWLSGPLVSEWWVGGPFRDKKGIADPHLYVQFGIRSYGRNKPLRIEANVENDWAYAAGPRTEFYDVKIVANGKTVYASNSSISQPSYTRWRFGFWWQDTVASYVRQNLAYLKKAHVVPNYDSSLQVSNSAVDELVRKFEAAPLQPMAPGIMEKYMPETGGRWDIGPLPHWQAVYLLTMDPRAYEVTLHTADLGAGFSAHYRNMKTRLPLTLDDYPKFSTHSNLVGHGPGQLPLPDSRGYRDPLTPDAAHEPAIDFIPYLITGDRFYLEELQFWTEWNLSGTDPVYRNFGQGLVKFDQVRAQAWSLRTLAQAAYITPNSSPLKKTFLRQLSSNIAWYENAYAKNPAANALHIIPQNDAPYDGGRAIAPWQDDFFTWSVGYVQGLGDVDTMALLRWKSAFSIARMTAPGFCWVMGSAYTLRVRPAANADYYQNFGQVYDASLPSQIKHPTGDHRLKCASPEMAAAFGQNTAGEMVAEPTSPDGFPAYMQPALAAAVDAQTPGADAAWRLFKARPVKPDFSTYPDWAIVPWRTEP
jgi:hypothetical protein